MTLQQLHNDSSLLLLKCISGSQSYGLALPHSDTDIKGIYILPQKEFYGLTFTDQVNNETTDEVYFEIKKFIDLLSKNNPNILELLNTPEDCILHKHPVMNQVKAEMFLSRLCNHSFAGYAYAQIKKARGLNKKILNPIDKQRKSILDFCYVVYGQGSIPLQRWLEIRQYNQKDCGLVRIDHMRDVYAIFHASQFQEAIQLQGISSGEDANDVSLSSVPKGIEPLSVLSFNRDGYSVYCREYKEYWDWVNKRNEERYSNTISHGKNYDSKNMMHVFRLLNMAEEIARYKQVNVRRKEREWLLRVRAGEFLYEDLLKQAEEKIALVDELFKHSDLPDAPDIKIAEDLLVAIREAYYQ
jgi:hypothetical protein